MNLNLRELLDAARARGLQGIVIIDQGGGQRPYTAASMSRGGSIVAPRAWDAHETPEAALADLSDQFGVPMGDIPAKKGGAA